MDWRFIRWVAWRNTPLFAAVFLPLAACGLWLSTFIPLTYESRSTMMLEQAPGTAQSSRPRPGEAAPERLRVIAQKVIAPKSTTIAQHPFDPDTLKLTVTAGRERATLLEIEASAETPDAALELNEMLIRAVRTEYEASLQLRLGNGQGAALVRVEEATENANTLSARLGLAHGVAALIPAEETGRITERIQSIATLEAQLARATGTPSADPARIKLESELEQALTIYSRAHPKVIMILQELNALNDPAPTTFQSIDPADLAIERLNLEARLAQINAARQDLATLQSDYADAQRELATARRDQDRLARQTSTNFAQEMRMLSVVVPPERPTGAAMPSPLLVQISTTLLALLIAGTTIWVRQLRDKTLYRAQDLERHLGITPFATLPRSIPAPV